jgi:2-polyprenyl-6-methoxyphenol hydroxylase-like FAD-dependent oxidoreductase
MLPQDETEKVLSDRLAALGGTIYRDVTATAAEQDADGARVFLESAQGIQAVSARYVVGGDGVHSMVRAAAQIQFDGNTYADSFVLADVRMDWAFGNSEVSLLFSPAGLLVVAPLPNGTFRVVATVDDAPEQPQLRDVQALIDARGPVARTSRVNEVVWSSRFRIHHRVARSYRSGRFLLMGDAAHVHSPAGGQGMNTGIVDAVVLGELLADVVKGQRADSELAAYQELRRPAARQVLGLSGILTRMATARGGPRRFVRNTLLSLVGSLPPAKHRMQMGLSGLSRKTLAVVPPPWGITDTPLEVS